MGCTGYQVAPPSQAGPCVLPDISIRPSGTLGCIWQRFAVTPVTATRQTEPCMPARVCVRVTCLRPPLLSIRAANHFSKKTLNQAHPRVGLLTLARCAAAGRCHGGHKLAGGFAGGNYEKKMKLWVIAIKPSLPGSGKLN